MVKVWAANKKGQREEDSEAKLGLASQGECVLGVMIAVDMLG